MVPEITIIVNAFDWTLGKSVARGGLIMFYSEAYEYRSTVNDVNPVLFHIPYPVAVDRSYSVIVILRIIYFNSRQYYLLLRLQIC